MKKRLILAAAAVVALSSVGVAQARDNINWSISVGDPFIGAVISNAPVYRHAAPVYVAPPVVYAPPPRVIYPRPYVVAPYGYAPYAYVHPGRDRWDHRRYEERTRYDRRDWRDGNRHDRDGRWDDRGGRHDDRWQRR